MFKVQNHKGKLIDLYTPSLSQMLSCRLEQAGHLAAGASWSPVLKSQVHRCNAHPTSRSPQDVVGVSDVDDWGRTIFEGSA